MKDGKLPIARSNHRRELGGDAMAEENEEEVASIDLEVLPQVFRVAAAASEALDDFLNGKPNAEHLRELVRQLTYLDDGSIFRREWITLSKHLRDLADQLEMEAWNRAQIRGYILKLWYKDRRKARAKESEVAE